MFKILKIIIPIILVIFFVKPIFAESGVNVYFFYGDGCPHCVKEEKFLDELKKEMPEIKIHAFEVWNNRGNAKMLAKLAEELNLNNTSVPITIIGDTAIPGYLSDSTTGKTIKSIVEYYTVNECADAVASILGIDNSDNKCVHNCDEDDTECMHNCGCNSDIDNSSRIPEKINLPILGEVKIKNASLPILTILIAALDGFNPCAMWALLFLISLLLGMKDRKRMWILGSVFVFTSGIVYFLFLSAWLNLFLFLGLVFWIRVAIGIVAMASGYFSLKKYFSNRGDKCLVEGSEKRKRFFDKLKDIIKIKKLWIALVGIILLAAAVNLVELFCSAGLPAIYTQVLSLSSLKIWQYYGYLLLYIFIFMLDDLLIFVIAMSTLKIKAISSRYTRWSRLIGGIIMLIIGILLLLKPGWLMFG